LESAVVADAELMIAPGCAHCPTVLGALSELVKQGKIGRLEVVNITRHPQLAAERGVRSVPWIRIGPFELNGAYSQGELANWAARAGSEAGLRDYLLESLGGGELDAVIASCRRSPELLPVLVKLAGDLETPLAVRIGVGAVFEDLAPHALPNELIDQLRPLAASRYPQIRADAAHLLGLLGGDAALGVLDGLLQDTDAEVREIASESLAGLADETRDD
jgi:thiol-disulfide isomerase/thioredoxin